ncbi:hypothetical protein [Calothrix sp. NIES-3974]|uniref:hypothetical protein n=1 Tax=Calothrix sp. NIES-3974 TaxID=2005462 RepID=UPI000B5EC89F|nr:hypothetical protein [Calothrix sp. NIES-3974]BAZ07464.1 hypothetical protein NIES3974_41270 [Calothrix sp. NIES-3974]
MSIIALRAWYIQDYEPISELEKRPPDMRLSKKSLLRSALRADFLEDSEVIKNSTWFGRYLEGETIEFYVEGSGGYCVANIDLISHEIYFTKQSLLSQLEPTIFLSWQNEFPEATEALREALQTSLEKLNTRSRTPLELLESLRPKESPLRLNRTMLRKIRKSLLFIADVTPITSVAVGDGLEMIPSPNVCVEIGYALQSKRSEQVLIAQMQRQEISGGFPFDLPPTQILQYRDDKELNKILLATLQNQLMRFKLL